MHCQRRLIHGRLGVWDAYKHDVSGINRFKVLRGGVLALADADGGSGTRRAEGGDAEEGGGGGQAQQRHVGLRAQTRQAALLPGARQIPLQQLSEIGGFHEPDSLHVTAISLHYVAFVCIQYTLKVGKFELLLDCAWLGALSPSSLSLPSNQECDSDEYGDLVQAVTAAAAMNDVGSWALVSFQATFYSRVYDLSPDVYAPALAAVLPIGGIIGGVTGGLAGDWLSRRGGRQWLTAGPPMPLARC